MISYNDLNTYLRRRFRRKVYKIPINGGFTCPNRDGTLGTGGCIFCSGYGSGDFAPDAGLSVSEQIRRGIEAVAAKMPGGKPGGKPEVPGVSGVPGVPGVPEVPEVPEVPGVTRGAYIAYFQAFTNTYAPAERLRKLYSEAIEHPAIAAVSIATRPDCLPEDVLDLLGEMNRIKPVWVELGLQTIHSRSAEYIRRGYDLAVYDRAVWELGKRGLETITHVILGIPGETREEMLETVKYVGSSRVQGIKLQLLHVIEGTDLAADYRAGKFECMTMDEYIDLIADCLKILPPDIVIHRMTGDGARKTLVAPLWSADKKRVLNALKKKLTETKV